MQTTMIHHDAGARAPKPRVSANLPVPTPPRTLRTTQRLAKGLGWFGIGLGLAELVVPRLVAAAIGTRGRGVHRWKMAALGVREVASGIGILAARRRGPWVWARVAGDAVDLALLVRVAVTPRDRRNTAQLVGAMAAVLGVTALDVYAALRLTRGADDDAEARERAKTQKDTATAVLTINRPPEDVYRFWRDFRNMPQFMQHVVRVEPTVADRSRWTVDGPADLRIEWEAEIVADRKNEAIVWRSVEGADVDNSGSVQFVRAAGHRGTEVWLEVRYDAPGGPIGKAVALLFGKHPSQLAYATLRRLKQLLETGEIMKSDASIHSGMHPAQPAEEVVR
jgi:uncharacterized membrane protein